MLTAFCNICPLFRTWDSDFFPGCAPPLSGSFLLHLQQHPGVLSALVSFLTALHSQLRGSWFIKGRISVRVSCFTVVVEKKRMNASWVLPRSAGRTSALLRIPFFINTKPVLYTSGSPGSSCFLLPFWPFPGFQVITFFVPRKPYSVPLNPSAYNPY